MSKFEVGQEVVLLDGTSLVGRIVDKAYVASGGELVATYKITVEGSTGRWYEAAELAPAAVAPALDTGGDAKPRTDLDAFTLEHWPRMFHERATADHWKDLYNDAAKNDILDVVATLQIDLAAARAALSPFAFCPIHPSWDDDTRCVILMNWRQAGLEVSVNEGLKLGDIRRAVQAAKQAPPSGGEGAE